MHMMIRAAGLTDLKTLLEFEQGVINAERPFDPTIKRGNTHYYDLERMITNDNTALVIAELNGEIIGCGYALIENAKSCFEYTQYSYLGFMYVKPEHRGEGVNKKIIDALKQWSLSKGIHELRLQVYCNNVAAIKAYEKAGFSKLFVTMRMKI
jgi:ribosomal protein S18 acetylase RimI-like enzyme